jgi:hypothetical protein
MQLAGVTPLGWFDTESGVAFDWDERANPAEHRLPSLCAQRSCTPLMQIETADRNAHWAHRLKAYVPEARSGFSPSCSLYEPEAKSPFGLVGGQRPPAFVNGQDAHSPTAKMTVLRKVEAGGTVIA